MPRPSPRPLLAALLLSLPAPLPAQAPAPLDAPTRARVVDSVARVLERGYVDEAVARRLGARLRERLASGAYDAEREPAAFGAALMRDLQGVVRDKHLRLSYEPERTFAGGVPAPGARVVARAPGAGAPGGAAPWGRVDARDSLALARDNFAFRRVARLDGNVGYLKLDEFHPTALSRETAAAAMAFLAHSEAVIIDLRDNRGGAPDLVEMLLSYFLPPEPRTLVTVRSRGLGVSVAHTSWRDLPGRRIGGVPLYILTSRRTASSGEMLPYIAQRLGIGVVVGDTTAGAGNGGNKVSVGAGLALFVPLFQVTSGPGYERTGVAPDVVADTATALETAHRLARERLAQGRAPAGPATPGAGDAPPPPIARPRGPGDATRATRAKGEMLEP